MAGSRVRLKVPLCFILIVLSLVVLSFPQSISAAPEEKEYDDAIVLLIDASSGMLGVEIEDSGTQAKKKLSFYVNPANVYVTNPINQILEFSNVRPGDQVDLVVSMGKDGKEWVTDITDYNRFEKN